MIKQYALLLIFMFLALLALISLQGYFSFNDYQIKTKEFSQAIDRIFSEAVEVERKERRTYVLSAFRAALSDPSKVKITASYDRIDEKTLYHIEDPDTKEKYTSISFAKDTRALDSLNEKDLQLTIDLLIEATGNYLDEGGIYYWTEALGKEINELSNTTIVDTNRLVSLYDSLLHLENIYSSFNIKLIDQAAALKKAQGEQSSFWQTKVYTTDLNSSRWDVYAYFDNPFREIIKKTWLTIGGSLFIIVLTGLAFFVLLKTIFQQKKLAEIKVDFIDNISHELQTPIATLRAANEGMEKFDVLKDPIKAERYVIIQKKAIHRLSNMVDELLRNSIYKRDFQIKSRINVDYQQLIQGVIVRYELKTEKKVTFDFELDPARPLLFTDPIAFETICDNIISNAIKHNNNEAALVKINTKLENSQFILTIADNGNIIPASLREKVFEKYYQKKPDTHGQGLGLAYIKQLVESLNGRIWISKSDTNGTQFNIQLPQ